MQSRSEKILKPRPKDLTSKINRSYVSIDPKDQNPKLLFAYEIPYGEEAQALHYLFQLSVVDDEKVVVNRVGVHTGRRRMEQQPCQLHCRPLDKPEIGSISCRLYSNSV
jgi:hypothetical protein